MSAQVVDDTARACYDPRQVRLALEFTNLMNLAARSEFIEVEPLDVQPGWPPEKYLITYRCRGIAGISTDGEPQYSEFHQVKMYLPSEYPLREPHLKWLTPIWHPNIDHQEPHHVCTNAVQNHWAGKPLSDLVRAMGEMVQYVRYHAVWEPPYPLDREAAEWVVKYAEPRGIVAKNRPVDQRPLLRAQRIRRSRGGQSAPRTPRVRLGRELRHRDSGTEMIETGGTRRLGTAALRRLLSALSSQGRALLDSTRLVVTAATCTSCAATIPESARFCPCCGVSRTAATRTCDECQTRAPSAHARFCPHCGAAISKAENNAAESNSLIESRK